MASTTPTRAARISSDGRSRLSASRKCARLNGGLTRRTTRAAAIGQDDPDGPAVGRVGDLPGVPAGEHRRQVGRQGRRRHADHRRQLGRRPWTGFEHQAVDGVFRRPDAGPGERPVEIRAKPLADREDVERERDPALGPCLVVDPPGGHRRGDRGRRRRRFAAVGHARSLRPGAALRSLEETATRLDPTVAPRRPTDRAERGTARSHP